MHVTPIKSSQLFTTKEILKIRMPLYKLLKCYIFANITRDGVLDVLLLEAKDAKKALETTCINKICVTASLKSLLPTEKQQRL